MSELNDEELVLRYQAQSDSPHAQAFINELFQRHHVRVAAWCYRMVGDRESAADLAQDIFLKAYRHLGSFRGNSKFTTWLYTITRNHCTSELRSRATRPEEPADMELLNLSDAAEPADDVIHRKNSEQLLRELMQEVLDETERRVMILHYAQELPLDTINRMLGFENPSGAKAHIVNARRKLSSAIARSQRTGYRAAIGKAPND